jgi:Pentose-5-phosphate-3-epimerase
MFDNKKLGVELEVDGGITADNAPDIIKAGANVLVVGAAVFKTEEGISQALQRIKRVIS